MTPQLPSGDKTPSIFQYADKPVRSFLDELGEPWFVAVDVCAVLGIDNVGNSLSRLDDDEKADIHIMDISSNGVKQSRRVITINESGLYSLILTSRKPEAKAFKKWITSEVLPAIRKTGSYTVQPSSPLEILKQQVAIMEAQEKRLAEHDDRLIQVESRLTGIERGTQWFTVLGYSIYMEIADLDNSIAGAIGRAASQMSEERNMRVGKVTDPRFGRVGTYHVSILEEIFKKRGLLK